MVRRTAEEVEQTRRDLLQAAQRLFAERGVSQTTLAQVASAAGMTRGAVYWHFDNKADLLRALWSEAKGPVNRFQEQIRAQLDEHGGLEALRSALLVSLNAVVNDEDYRQSLRIMLINSEQVGELAECFAQEDEQIDLIVDGLAQLLGKLKQAGELAPALDPAVAASGLTAYVIGLIYEYLKRPAKVPLDCQAEALLDLYLRGLRP